MLSIVARACQSFKNGAREWRWPTKAQLTRRVFVETSMSWAGSDTGRHRASISERKVSWHVCVSSSSVGQSAGLVVCNCMVPGSALVGYWLFCCVLDFPLLCDYKSMSPIRFNFILTFDSYWSVAIVPWLALGSGESPDSL